jgi:hypothetical protein
MAQDLGQVVAKEQQATQSRPEEEVPVEGGYE